MANFFWFTIISAALVNLFCHPKLSKIDCHSENSRIILPGATEIDSILSMTTGRSVGLVANHASLVYGVHLADTLLRRGVSLKVLFTPEHGFRGLADAGETVVDSVDESTGLPLRSLYGKNKKPSSGDLNNLDLMIFDLQDVGTRFYTYISTLHYVMEACARHGIKLIVLDRPNPNGHYIDGPVLDPSFKSFVGLHPIPVVYGMTIGELARMIQGECWIEQCDKLELQVLKCRNYRRNELVSLSTPPSPNLRDDRAILLYPGLCFFEGTVVSVARGTSFPFHAYGHPKLKGPFSFRPLPMPGAKNPPWNGTLCYGTDLSVHPIESLFTKAQLDLSYLFQAYHELSMGASFFSNPNFFDRLAGTDALRSQVESKATEEAIRESWKYELNAFKIIRSKYLLYPE
jgi:uncharacterized protein YbbC (DUF1343 family)